MSATSSHWQTVYLARDEQQTSWFRPHLDESLRMIDALDLDRTLPVIDVGGGRSTLTDDLLARGFTEITVLDLSDAALTNARERLGNAGCSVQWIASDILQATLPAQHYGLWHDRAAFHFLTDPADRHAYANAAAHAIRPGGHLLLATFAADGPTHCSGLPVQRYTEAELADEFAPAFEPLASSQEIHTTPAGKQQSFIYLLLRRLITPQSTL